MDKNCPKRKLQCPREINEKIIVADDGSEYCETEGRKMENKDRGGIKRSK